MAGEWGDLISMDFENPQQDDQLQLSMPESGWSMGQSLGSADFQMPDFSQYVENLGGSAPDASLGNQGFNQTWYNPTQSYDSGGSQWYNPSTWGNSATTSPTAPPSIGGMGGSGSPIGGGDDDWKKELMKGGMGIGTSLAGAGIGALLKAGTQPSNQGPQQPQMAPASPLPLPPAPVGTYQMAPMEPLPGTKASPLISGGPKQVNMTQGLVNDRIKRGGSAGGFQMY